MIKQDIKNAVNMLMGKTADALNKKFMLVANVERGNAILHFKADDMTHYEDGNKPVSVVTPAIGSLIEEGTDLKELGLPSQVLKNYERAKKVKDEIESMGISDVQIGYSNAAIVSKNNGPAKRAHEIFIVFPIDNEHGQNRLVARSMAKRDRVGVNYYRR